MISNLKKKLSYIYPITQTVSSVYNGTLEITYTNGKKILNTKNTNYSFGSLHKVMQFSLNRITIKGDSPILLLGLGGGSAVKIIRNEFLKTNHIDIVDIDSVMIEIARKEFGLNDYSDLQVYCQNASSFVEETNNKYGLIIIDLFIDKITPMYFYDSVFWTDVLTLTKKKCCIIFNTLTSNNTTEKINNITKILTNAKFEVLTYKEVELSNTVLIAKRI